MNWKVKLDRQLWSKERIGVCMYDWVLIFYYEEKV